MKNINIRIASAADADKLLNIYAPYVKNTAISFEYDVPTVEEFARRITTTLKNYPYLVAEVDKRIVGYCYAGSFHSREAYRHAAEVSIYISEEYREMGIGRELYKRLESLLIRQNVYILCACVTCSDRQDDYLPNASPAFHQHMGYRQVGIHENCGYKFDRWYSICWFEKLIAERPEHPISFVPFDRLTDISL